MRRIDAISLLIATTNSVRNNALVIRYSQATDTLYPISCFSHSQIRNDLIHSLKYGVRSSHIVAVTFENLLHAEHYFLVVLYFNGR